MISQPTSPGQTRLKNFENNQGAPRVLDLFCGCGGFSLGLRWAGFQLAGGIDTDEDALKTYKRNLHVPVMQKDIREVAVDEVRRMFGEKIDVIVGGPPCQGFSMNGKRRPDDPRNPFLENSSG